MVNYQDTKIYYIKVGDDKYYGHSAQKYLSKRERGHKKAFNSGKQENVYKMMRELNFTKDDIVCVWVEDWPCNNLNEAKARERYWIEREGTLNRAIPTRTNHEYYEDHKEDLAEYHKEYKKKNKQSLAEYRKEYREKNKDNLAEKHKEYGSVKAKCPHCEKEMRRTSLSRHITTQHPTI